MQLAGKSKADERHGLEETRKPGQEGQEGQEVRKVKVKREGAAGDKKVERQGEVASFRSLGHGKVRESGEILNKKSDIMHGTSCFQELQIPTFYGRSYYDNDA